MNSVETKPVIDGGNLQLSYAPPAPPPPTPVEPPLLKRPILSSKEYEDILHDEDQPSHLLYDYTCIETW